MLQAQSNCFTRLLQCCLPIRQNFAYLRFCKIQISAMSESTQLSQGACVSVNKAVSISDCSERKGQQHGLGRRAVQSRAGQGRAGQGRAGLGRAGQGRAGQGRAGQGGTGQDTKPKVWALPIRFRHSRRQVLAQPLILVTAHIKFSIIGQVHHVRRSHIYRVPQGTAGPTCSCYCCYRVASHIGLKLVPTI